MDLQAIELTKARAHDALVRGSLTEADRLYGALEAEYEHHGFVEGLLAVQHNRLLGALEIGDRKRVGDVLRAILGRIAALDGYRSPLIDDVCRSLAALFDGAVPGVEPELASRVEVAVQRYSGPSPVRRIRDAARWAAVDVGPLQLIGLEASDVARILTTWASAPMPPRDDTAAEAVSALRRQWREADHDGSEPLRPLADYHRALEHGDTARAYASLVNAIEHAAEHNPAWLSALDIGARALEEGGLPRRVDYAPGLPRERRLAAAVMHHAALGDLLGLFPGWEALAQDQWREVVSLSDRWLERVRQRRGRGSGRATDERREARVSVARARALASLGRLGEAREAIAHVAGLAAKGAYAERRLCAEVLLATAALAERWDERVAAGEAYDAAARLALPGLQGASSVVRQAQLVDAAVARNESERVLIGVRAITGAARVGVGIDGPSLDGARAMLALLRPHVLAGALADAALDLELTAAAGRDRIAADRACEIARACANQPATALAVLYRALALLDDATDENTRARAMTEMTRAAGEARLCPQGAVRRTIEVCVGLAHLDAASDGDEARVAIHLRRAAEGACAIRPDGAGAFDVYLPRDRSFALVAVIKRLIDAGRGAFARRLCAVERRRRVVSFPVWTSHEMRDRTRRYHRQLFQEAWGCGSTRASVDDELPDVVAGAAPQRTWGRREPGTDEAWLEFHAFESCLIAFVSTIDDVQAFRWHEPQERLQRRVAEILGRLRTGGESARIEGLVRQLYSLLIDPVRAALKGRKRLIVAPDGPLCALPFALLTGVHRLLDEFELVIAWPANGPPPEATVKPLPSRVLIVGDGATARDLRLSTLVGEGHYAAVEVRHGCDLSPDVIDQVLGPAHIVHLVGRVVDGPSFELRDQARPVSAEAIARAMARGGVTCATVLGPVEGPLGRAAVSQLLCGVVGGVLVRHWETEDDNFIQEFVREAAGATDADGLVRALAVARRRAIISGVPPRAWAAYDLYIAESS